MDRSESLVLPAAELEFCLYDWLDAESLTARPRFADHSRETFDDVIDLSRRLAEELFLPHNRAADLAEPQLVDGAVRLIDEVEPALDAFAEAGLLASTMSFDDGGFQLPHVVNRVAFMWLQTANIATASYPMLTIAAAHLIRAHAAPGLAERFLPPMLDGRWYGTMNLSEPGVGSALGDLTTTAVRQADGSYRVRGDKMWISGGDHDLGENIVHLVLARTGGPGVKGLSLLIVPKHLGEPGALEARNDVVLVGLNHKMGYRGTVNTHLRYGSGAHPVDGGPGAVGYLIGEEGQGLRYMFLMMNEARLGVGAGAAGLAATGFLHARAYARQHEQGRDLADKSPAASTVPIVRHPDVRRMLLASKAYAEGGIAVVLYAARLLDEAEACADAGDRRTAELLLDVLTPVAKSWPSQWGLIANDHAIQIHGGSGYTRDFPVEQFYRDNRLNPIHEGTHGIQALDLLGRKVLLENGAGFAELLRRARATADATRAREAELADALAGRLDRLESATSALWAAGDPTTALANAADYLEAAGDIVVAWLLLDQLRALGERDDEFARAKRLTVAYFIAHLLPRVDPQLDRLASADRLLADLDESLI